MVPASPVRSSPRHAVARRAVRAVNQLSRLTGRGDGTVIGGRVGLALAPDLLARLLAGRDVVLVSGTNGKTTTTALVRAALGTPVATNATGANMPAGHVAALADSGADVAVLEVDEAWLPTVMVAAGGARRRALVLLNLSRDQLDRAGEVRQLAERWRAALGAAPRGAWTVVANVSDPLVAFAVEKATDVVACAVPVTWTQDARSCPHCTRALDPDASGAWRCECGFGRPATAIEVSDGAVHGLDAEVAISLPGSFNLGNAALALAVGRAWGVDPVAAAARVAAVSSVAGRFEVRRWRGRTWRLMLAKNPAGVAALMPELSGSSDDLVVAINANIADGRDPSWLHDAPFGALAHRRVWCDGTRDLDLAVRLAYDGVATAVVRDEPGFPAAVEATDPIDVVANYTSFVAWREKSTPC